MFVICFIISFWNACFIISFWNAWNNISIFQIISNGSTVITLVGHEIFVIGGDAKGSKIKQEFIQLENGTKVLVDVDLKFRGKMKISVMFGKNDFKRDYDNVLDDFVKIAEN